MIPRILLSFFLTCAPAFAQIGAAGGSIRGTVQDPAGSAVPKAAVKARNIDTGFERSALSSQDGEFEVPLLAPGRYEVTVAANGFAPFTQTGVVVQLAKASALDIRLALASAQQSVTVEADATILNTATTDVSGHLNSKAMENLPLTTRNTFNLALFAPGFNGRRDDEFGNPTFAFGGMQRRAFLIDGIDNSQRGGPGRLGIFAPETVQEVRVIANSMDAEYGRTVGGMISMITRGGTNDVHGEGLVLLRRPGLVARPSLAATKAFEQWATYAGNVGGPVIRNKLMYYVSGEYEPYDYPRAVTITPGNASALHLPASDLGSSPFKQRFQTFLGRADYQINGHNSLYVRYNSYWDPSKYNTSGGLLVTSADNNFDDRNVTWASQWTSILSPSTVNEFRFGSLEREFFRPPVSGTLVPTVSISGVATLGTDASANQYYLEHQYNFIDGLSHRHGRHQIKAGFDIATIHVISKDRLTQTFTFSNLTNYLNTVNQVVNPATGTTNWYTQLVQAFGNNTADHTTNSFNFYAQDTFQITPALTLSYGLRYEFLSYPSLDPNAPLANSRSVRSDPADWAPRFGFAWRADSKTVVRGGYGLFYDTLNLRLLSQVIRQNGSNVLSYTITPSTPGAPIFPNLLSSPAGTLTKPNVTTFSPDFKQMRMQQANVQVERALGTDVSLTAGFQYYGGRHIPVLLDTNLGAPVGALADGRPVFTNANRPNPSFNQVLQLTPAANSLYYGGFLAISKRFSRDFQFTASYTLGWALNTNDSTGDAGSNVTDSTSLRRDYGPSSSDQRHRFVLQGVWQPGVRNTILGGWMISPNVTLTSPFPVNVSQGSDLNGDGINNDRPLFRGRNDTSGYGFKEVNLRISRAFAFRERYRLELIAEAENLLNSLNAACSTAGCTGAVVSTFNAPDFKRITAATDSRQIQIGGRIRF
jgi:carboxypeptidase family protein/TonB-dependent receptor-like protein